jgi:hypothetical protein
MEHLEHAEHPHEAHSPFDRRVAMTIAIVAACLACVTMLSHRAHNETLRLQAEANQLITQVDVNHTKASNQWNYYQAKKNRQYMYDAQADLLSVLPTKAHEENGKTTPVTPEKVLQGWRSRSKKYEEETKDIEKEAREYMAKADEIQDEAKALLKKSEEEHHRGDRMDLGELGVELALVLCSLAILTKRAGFWYWGIIATLIGVGVGVSAFFLPG